MLSGAVVCCEMCGVEMTLTHSQVLRQRKIKVVLCDNCYSTKRSNDNKRTKSYCGPKFSQLKNKAAVRGIEVSIDLEYYAQNLYNKPCHYCGGIVVHSGGGVDRVDSSKGYTVENSVPCCPTCNVIKNDHSNQDLVQHMIKMLQYQGYNVEKKS